jgi:hypothetical protein
MQEKFPVANVRTLLVPGPHQVPFLYLFPPGFFPLISFSPLPTDYIFGCILVGGLWQAALDVITS